MTGSQEGCIWAPTRGYELSNLKRECSVRGLRVGSQTLRLRNCGANGLTQGSREGVPARPPHPPRPARLPRHPRRGPDSRFESRDAGVRVQPPGLLLGPHRIGSRTLALSGLQGDWVNTRRTLGGARATPLRNSLLVVGLEDYDPPSRPEVRVGEAVLERKCFLQHMERAAARLTAAPGTTRAAPRCTP